MSILKDDEASILRLSLVKQGELPPAKTLLGESIFAKIFNFNYASPDFASPPILAGEEVSFEPRISNAMAARIVIGLSFAVTILLGGCSTADVISSHLIKGWLEPDATLVEAAIAVDPDANINLRGGRAPIKLRFYLLTSTSVFNKASYFALKDQDKDLLGKELKADETVTYAPGEQAQLEMVLPPDALSEDEKLYFGVWAGYIDLDNAKNWHDAIEVEVGEESRVIVKVDPLNLSLKLAE